MEVRELRGISYTLIYATSHARAQSLHLSTRLIYTMSTTTEDGDELVFFDAEGAINHEGSHGPMAETNSDGGGLVHQLVEVITLENVNAEVSKEGDDFLIERLVQEIENS